MQMKEASVNQVDGFVAVGETALYQGSAFHISKTFTSAGASGHGQQSTTSHAQNNINAGGTSATRLTRASSMMGQ
jgi:hypothetical protein